MPGWQKGSFALDALFSALANAPASKAGARKGLQVRNQAFPSGQKSEDLRMKILLPALRYVMKKMPGVGVAVMVVREGKVLLGKRHEDPVKADSALHGEGTWTLPGGKLDFHEKPAEGVIRECSEETGILIKDPELISVGNEMVHDNHFVTLGFIAKEFEGEPKAMEPDEITEWRWFPLTELPKPMFPPAEKIIKNYIENKIYSDE